MAVHPYSNVQIDMRGQRYSMTTAIYDGNCVLCQQTRRLVTALDWRRRVEFVDIHDWNGVQVRYPQLDYAAAMGEIHVDTGSGALLSGFTGMRRLLRDLPLAYPLWLALHLPGMNWLGPKLYAAIARNRYRINRVFGVDLCETGTCKLPGKS